MLEPRLVRTERASYRTARSLKSPQVNLRHPIVLFRLRKAFIKLPLENTNERAYQASADSECIGESGCVSRPCNICISNLKRTSFQGRQGHADAALENHEAQAEPEIQVKP